MARKAERKNKPKPNYVREQKAYPMPEALDGEKDWKVDSSSPSSTVLPARQMHVPLGTDAVSQGVRMHEMLHVAYTPENWQTLTTDAKIDPAIVQLTEDYRIEYLGKQIDIDTGDLLTEDEAKTLGGELLKNPLHLASVILAAKNNHDVATNIYRGAMAMAHNQDHVTWVERNAEKLEKLPKRIKDNPDKLTDYINRQIATTKNRQQVVRKAWQAASVVSERYQTGYDEHSGDRLGLPDMDSFDASIGMARELMDALPRDINDMLPKPEAGPTDDLTDKGEHKREKVEESIGDMAPAMPMTPDKEAEEMRKLAAKVGGKPSRSPASGEWGTLMINRWPLPQIMPSRLRGNLPALTDEGVLFAAPYRMTIDQKVFRTIRKRPGGGAVLIDRSGSMGLTIGEVLAIMQNMPAAIIASYSGNGKQGRLDILAHNGRRARDSHINNNFGGGNVVDGPALLWLAEQKGPRFWVSDAHVTGVGDHMTDNLRHHAFYICKKHRIRRFDHLAAVVEFTGKQGLVIR